MTKIAFYDSRAYMTSYQRLEDVRVLGVRWDADRRTTVQLDVDQLSADKWGFLSDRGMSLDGQGWVILPEGVWVREVELATRAEAADCKIATALFAAISGYRTDCSIVLHVDEFYLTQSVYDLIHLVHLFRGESWVTAEPLIDDAHLIPRSFSFALDRRQRRAYAKQGDGIINFFTSAVVREPPPEGRFLDLGPEINDLVAVLPEECIMPVPPPIDGSESPLDQPPAVFGVAPDWSHYTLYNAAPDRYLHLAGTFRMCPWTTPWDKVLIHRARDGWRVLACMLLHMPWMGNRTEANMAKLNYVVAMRFRHDELPQGRVPIRGVPENVASIIAQVPGMSLMMMQVLNTIRGLRRRINMSDYRTIKLPMPANHVIVSTGVGWDYRNNHMTGDLRTPINDGPWYCSAHDVQRLRTLAERCMRPNIAGPNLLVADSEEQEISLGQVAVQPVATRPVRLFRQLKAIERERSIIEARKAAPIARELDL